VPDTPANRQAFGSAGTADDSSPYPQPRELRISAASTRATFGVVTGPSGAGGARDKGEAEQVLLDKALKDYRYMFTPWRLWVMDRNFPGVPRIKAMLATGPHVLFRGQGRHHAAPSRRLSPEGLVPGGDPAQEGVRSPRAGSAQLQLQYAPDRSNLSRSARGECAAVAGHRRPDRRGLADQSDSRPAAELDLPSRRAGSRPGVVRHP